MSKILIVAMSVLLLAACSNQHSRRGDAFDRAGQEVGAAAAGKTNRSQGDVVGQAMVPPLQLEQPVAAKPEPRFNLAVNNAPVGQVLNALVSGTPYSMLFPPELSGTVSLNLKNTTVRDALETLRDVYGYDYRFQGNRIYVQPNTIQTRLFKINYLANRRLGTSDMRVTGSSPTTSNSGTPTTASAGQQTSGTTGGTTGGTAQRVVDSARVQTTSDFDFWKDLTVALSTIVGNQDGRNVIVNPGSGVVLVKATPVELRGVDEYLKATQLVVERQVMLEAKIIEVSLNDSYQTGINWSKFGGIANRFSLGVVAPSATLAGSGAISGSAAGISGGTSVAAVPGSGGAVGTGPTGRGFFGLTFQSNNFAALLSFLEGQGDVQVLSSPRIATTNNQKAVLKVGTDDYFVTGISTNVTTGTGTAGNVVTPNITLQPFFSGISLDVTPQIDDEGNIILHVHPSVSVVEEKSKSVNLGDLGTYTLPLASSTINESDSIVRVQDGSIVAIGGLMSQEQNTSRYGLPGISGVPGLGLLFGQKSVSNRKRELVILMKSTVIRGENSWREVAGESQERMQALDPRQQRHIEWQ
ncbi:pilus (MSHA type) biogenesis protein MshL [Ferribacterium limneticum]|uniref:pilus (MSHA type) biogenesis protein MshL n=1 Tax=Ferribacterium limneticum TaxID=76259 RepID=UPI001CFB38E0|nr:pilus (MSHA type) biogenesis protein MshL [Ferribacterium limneticum]UCV27505.1 pilus (MSHA type) biogenesis protein MshL [Ferribacterium limneticum]UCV31422.1 pilus (MSHA type) biogenesis protein MshL [Ferribacterium limneticum]